MGHTQPNKEYTIIEIACPSVRVSVCCNAHFSLGLRAILMKLHFFFKILQLNTSILLQLNYLHMYSRCTHGDLL